MSEFPPPNIGPDAGGTPPQQPLLPGTTPQPPSGFQPGAFHPPQLGPVGGQVGLPVSGLDAGPQPSGRAPGSKRPLIIVSVVAVLVLAAVGTFLATRSDDSDSSSSDTATEQTNDTASTDVSDTATDDTIAPDTTVEDTSTTEEATTTTEAPTTTSVFSVPDGAIDLGHQVFLPIPAGWSQTNDPGDVVVIADGAGSSASFQALARDAGEDITALTQEYTDTFDADFGAVGFGPMRFVRQIDGPLPVIQYGLSYTTYDPGQVDGIDGAVNIFVRSDGLSLVYDSYTTVELIGLPDDSYQGMLNSLLDAEPLGPSVPLVQHDPFRVTSLSPFLEVQGVIGFTTTPGFNTVTAGAGHAFTSNGTEDIEVITANTQPDTATLIATAQGYLATNYTNTTFTAPVEDAPNLYGVVHGRFTWSGTYIDGTASAGTIDYSLDPASQNAYVMYRNWFTTAGPDEPFAAEGAFMQRCFDDSLTTIP